MLPIFYLVYNRYCDVHLKCSKHMKNKYIYKFIYSKIKTNTKQTQTDIKYGFFKISSRIIPNNEMCLVTLQLASCPLYFCCIKVKVTFITQHSSVSVQETLSFGKHFTNK